MLNEWKEFRAYTGTVSYTASRKSDMTYLGRFTFATILEFEGMARILAILARGYLFHDKSGAVVSGDPRDRIAYARRALCAWCSAPEKGKTAPKDEWQFKTDFLELRVEFPELVDADGTGWFLRHVLAVADFMLTHPEKVRSILENDIECMSARHDDAAAMYDKASSVAPAFGMVGTLVGLINMLKGMNLEEGNTNIGSDMGTALITTLYGCILAHMFFGPIATQLRNRDEEEVLCKMIIVEGVMSIQAGENPKFLRERLLTYMEQMQRELANGESGEGGKKSRKKAKKADK